MDLPNTENTTHSLFHTSFADVPSQLYTTPTLGVNLPLSAGMHSAYVDTQRSISPAGSVIQLHCHDYYELIYCRQAAHAQYQLGDQQYALQQGDILFIAPNVLHRPILPKHGDDAYIRDIIRIHPAFLENIYGAFMAPGDTYADKSGLYRLDGIAGAGIGELFRKGIWEAEAQEVGWEAAVVANSLSILAQLRRAMAHEKRRKPEGAALLDQMLAYVELHFAEKLTMGDVARHFFISESTITQTFRKKLGVSFYRCVTQRRLTAAKSLMEQGLPLDDVAEQTGFSDYSSFFRAFKQEYEVSPRQYRKMLLTDGK